MEGESITERTKIKREKAIAIAVFILSIALSLGFFVFQDFFRESKSLGLLGLFIINFVSNASFFISAPAIISVFVAGDLYSPIIVAVVSSLGAACGDSLSFVLGFSGRHVFNKKLEKHLWFRVLEDFFKSHGFFLLFIFSFFPNPFFDSLGIIAGIFNYSPKKFLVVVFIGRLLRYFLVAKFGSLI